jgi:NADPH:quinone reductase-like Zn-dependent oxidoreductase
VATLTYGGFSEYALEKARFVVPVHAPTAEVVALLTSGLTASIALEEARMVKGQTALVTAAAGALHSIL